MLIRYDPFKRKTSLLHTPWPILLHQRETVLLIFTRLTSASLLLALFSHISVVVEDHGRNLLAFSESLQLLLASYKTISFIRTIKSRPILLIAIGAPKTRGSTVKSLRKRMASRIIVALRLKVEYLI